MTQENNVIVVLENLIKNTLTETFANSTNLDRAIEKVKIQHSNIADYQLNCRGISSYLDMPVQFIEVANKIKVNIPTPTSLVKKVDLFAFLVEPCQGYFSMTF